MPQYQQVQLTDTLNDDDLLLFWKTNFGANRNITFHDFFNVITEKASGINYDDAIILYNRAIEAANNAEESEINAANSATASGQSATASANSATASGQSATNSNNSAISASESSVSAGQYADIAEGYADDAQDYAADALASKNAAAQSETNAQNSAQNSEQAAADAEEFRNQAEQEKNAAQQAKQEAESAAEAAEIARDEARQIAGINDPQQQQTLLAGPLTGAAGSPTMKDVADVLRAVGAMGKYYRPTPIGFGWPVPFEIYLQLDGIYRSTWTPRQFRPKPFFFLYVDYVNGNNSNDGTSWGAAFKTLAGALDSDIYKTNSPHPFNLRCEIKVAWALYVATEDMNGLALMRPTSLVGETSDYGEQVRFFNGIKSSSISWTQQSAPNANVYRTTVASRSQPWDNLVRNSDGSMKRYTPVGSVADCQALPGSFYITVGDYYIHTFRSAAPDADVLIVNDNTRNLVGATSEYPFYAENISFEGGQYAFRVLEAGYTNQVTFSRCATRYAMRTGLQFERSGAIMFIGSHISEYNGHDGISYNNATLGLETDCCAHYNGWDRSLATHNGSTAHLTSRVVRVNGRYTHNWDRNVHDVHNSQTWNLGCIAGYALTGSGVPYDAGDWAVGTAMPNGNTEVWLEGCRAEGSAGPLICYAPSKLHLAATPNYPRSGNGTFVNYSP